MSQSHCHNYCDIWSLIMYIVTIDHTVTVTVTSRHSMSDCHNRIVTVTLPVVACHSHTVALLWHSVIQCHSVTVTLLQWLNVTVTLSQLLWHFVTQYHTVTIDHTVTVTMTFRHLVSHCHNRTVTVTGCLSSLVTATLSRYCDIPSFSVIASQLHCYSD